MDVRVGRATLLAALALLLTLLIAAPAGAQQPQPRISQARAVEIAKLDPTAVAET